MLVGRKSRAVRASVVAALAVVAAGLVAPGASADPEPTIDDVQQRVDELHHEAEQAAERYNTLRAQLGDARDELRAVRADVARQSDDTELLRTRVEALVLSQVDGNNVSTTTRLLLSEDPDEFLSSVVAMQSYSDQTADLLVSYENARAELTLREQRAKEQLAAITAGKQQMAREKAEIEQKAAAAEALLAELEAAAAARAAQEPSRDEVRPPTTTGTDPAPPATPAPTTEPAPTPVVAPGGSAAAQTAVETALAQVGDAYVYGAAGPDAFDCSGLTMYSWAAAGVALSHSSSIQSGQGVPVSVSDIAPGDLVFYYSPISHVGMYVGNGMVVHAPNPSRSVEVVPMSSMPISWVRRVG